MARTRRLVVGLGNPSPEYETTRHNVGFAVLDLLIGKGRFKLSGRAQSMLSEARFRGHPVILAKPQTYMNRSGQAVQHLARRYALSPKEIIVVLDDLNLPLGRIRIRAKGGAGGHNGLQDIIDCLKNDAFARIRVGIAGEYERGQQRRFVLTPFNASEHPVIDEALARAAQAATVFVTDGIAAAMNRFNRRPAPVAARPEDGNGAAESGAEA